MSDHINAKFVRNNTLQKVVIIHIKKSIIHQRKHNKKMKEVQNLKEVQTENYNKNIKDCKQDHISNFLFLK